MIFDALPYDCWRRRDPLHGQASVHRYCATSAGAAQIKSNANRRDWSLNIKRLERALRDEDFDLPTELVRVLKEGKLNDFVRASLMTKLMEYLEPKQRATTITVNNRPIGELTEGELRALAGIVNEETSSEGIAGAPRGKVVPFRLRSADEPVSDTIEAPRLPAE